MRLKSHFAILDVQHGRKQLARIMPDKRKRLPDEDRIPVVIHGYISHQHRKDNGSSIEFGVDVTNVEVGE